MDTGRNFLVTFKGTKLTIVTETNQQFDWNGRAARRVAKMFGIEYGVTREKIVISEKAWDTAARSSFL